jgi:hypothetical protein
MTETNVTKESKPMFNNQKFPNNEALNKFNDNIILFLNDLKKIDLLNEDVENIQTFTYIMHIESTKRTIIRNFQTHVLRDVFAVNIYKKNVYFFIRHNFSNDLSTSADKIVSLINKIQKIVEKLKTLNKLKSIDSIFNWLALLCYYAYMDLGIDPNQKIKQLMV